MVWYMTRRPYDRCAAYDGVPMLAATLFTGFDGAGLGMEAAGLDVAWGIEKDPDIAAVANRNLRGRVRILDILAADPRDFPPVDVLHASPPCPNFSTANANKGETAADISLACKVADFIAILQPRIFTLENVWGYRKSQSWRLIENTLSRCGYWFDIDHVNAADFGVPQTRQRMIVRALCGQMVPHLPPPEPWVGWYAAIEDLIPTLPESRFAPWQLARLPEELKTYLIGNDRNGDDRDRLNLSASNDPAFTVTSSNGPKLKAFLVPGENASNDTIRFGEDPATTVGSTNRVGNRPRAFLANPVDGLLRSEIEPSSTVMSSDKTMMPRAFLMAGSGNTNFADAEPGKGMRLEDEPAHVIASDGGGRTPKAFILGNGSRSDLVPECEPADTVTANSNQTGVKAFLVASGNTSNNCENGLIVKDPGAPSTTVIANADRTPMRAWLSSGRVVSLTPRALARLQTIPDWYQLTGKNGLDCRGIGNACPSLLFEKIYRQLLECL